MTAAPSKKHLFLTGYRGCGKSTIAKLLATRLGMEAVDTDEAIETEARQTIREIFEREGESGFRDRETHCIRALVLSETPRIIALGGGAILRPENRQTINQSGWTAWLQASPETLAVRIASDNATSSRRPSLSRLGVLDEVASILAARLAFYQEVSDLSYDTERVAQEGLADNIAQDYRWWLEASA